MSEFMMNMHQVNTFAAIDIASAFYRVRLNPNFAADMLRHMGDHNTAKFVDCVYTQVSGSDFELDVGKEYTRVVYVTLRHNTTLHTSENLAQEFECSEFDVVEDNEFRTVLRFWWD